MKYLKKNKKFNKKKLQKSFYFDDYIPSNEFNAKDNYALKISSDRIIFIFLFFICLIFIFSIKIFYLIGSNDYIYSPQLKNYQLVKSRTDIVDRNGVILARSIDGHSAAIRNKLVKDKKKLIINLKIIFPDLNINYIQNKLNNKKINFFYIKKRITEEERIKLWLLGDKAVTFEKKQFRIYPQKNLFSHVIGQVDYDNNGISGVEKYFDNIIKDKEKINSSLKLTLDSNLQFLIREELLEAKKIFKTIGSAAILMNIENGEILSLISLPDYDLNKRISIKKSVYTNKITKGVYELGSVFKTFTIASGLENNVINSNTVFKNLKSNLKCDKYTISEHDPLPKNLSAEQILIRSSNIGAVKIIQKVGKENYENFLNSLELFQRINFDLDEVGTPISFKWGKCKLATASYGHGVTTTPLQLAKAYAILGNGGYKIKPTILTKKVDTYKKGEKIISTQTSNEINSILRKAVSLKEGTANWADIEGYTVGGKTGTSLKYNSTAKLNTFVSIFPTNKPKYVLLVMLDEPKAAPSLVYSLNNQKMKGINRNESGWNSVYVAGKIIKKIGPILAIKNLQAFKKP